MTWDLFKDTDNEICRKLAGDTKLGGATDTHKGQNAIQKNLDKLEKWALGNFMKLNKTRYKVLHLDWGNLPLSTDAGWERN